MKMKLFRKQKRARNQSRKVSQLEQFKLMIYQPQSRKNLRISLKNVSFVEAFDKKRVRLCCNYLAKSEQMFK